MSTSRSLPASLSDLIKDPFPLYTVEQKIAKLRKSFIDKDFQSSELSSSNFYSEIRNNRRSSELSSREGSPLLPTNSTALNSNLSVSLTQIEKMPLSSKKCTNVSSKATCPRKKKNHQVSSPQTVDSSPFCQAEPVSPSVSLSKSDRFRTALRTKKRKDSPNNVNSESTIPSTLKNNEDISNNPRVLTTNSAVVDSYKYNSLISLNCLYNSNTTLQKESPKLDEDTRKLISYAFDKIYSNIFSRLLLEPEYDLTLEEVNFHQNKLSSLDELFEKLYNIIKKYQKELSEVYSKNSEIYKRSIDFHDYLKNLKSDLTSPKVSEIIDNHQPVLTYLKDCGSIELNSESKLYFIRIANGEKISNKGYNVNEVYYMFHQPLFNWIRRKLHQNSFDVITDKIGMLEVYTNIVFRLYISGSRSFIVDCTEDSNSCLLLYLSIDAEDQENHFILALKPIGKISPVGVDTTCGLDKPPKAWVWVKVIKVLQVCSEFQCGKIVPHKPVSIGTYKEGLNQARFKNLCEFYSNYFTT